jgi:UDP-N-acetyl-D-mannosaminuronic acid dehydrogenase
MPAHTVERLETKLEAHGIGLSDASVLVLGLTYRPGVEELRYAPAIDVIELLRDLGTEVYAHDPLVDPETISEFGAISVSDPTESQGVDGIILATGHEQYDDLDLEALHETLDTPIFVDGRAFFDSKQLASFDYTAIGKPD